MTTPIIPFIDIASLSEEDKALMNYQTEAFGMVHNSMLTYMHRPAIAKALMGMYGALMNDADVTLPADLKGKLGIICSSINNCSYCTSHQCSAAAHPAEGTAGLSEDEIISLVNGMDEGKDAFEAACFEYARAASYDPASVSETILENLKKELTPAQIVELAVVVGLWKMVNTIHDTLKLPIEDAMQEYTHFIDHKK